MLIASNSLRNTSPCCLSFPLLPPLNKPVRGPWASPVGRGRLAGLSYEFPPVAAPGSEAGGQHPPERRDNPKISDRKEGHGGQDATLACQGRKPFRCRPQRISTSLKDPQRVGFTQRPLSHGGSPGARPRGVHGKDPTTNMAAVCHQPYSGMV